MIRKADPKVYGDVCEVDMLVTSNLTAYAAEERLTPEGYRADVRTNSDQYGKNTGHANEKLPGAGYPRGK